MIDTNIYNQSRKYISEEVEILNRKKSIETKIRKVHPSLLQKKAVL